MDPLKLTKDVSILKYPSGVDWWSLGSTKLAPETTKIFSLQGM
jgi:hypothetical protein